MPQRRRLLAAGLALLLTAALSGCTSDRSDGSSATVAVVGDLSGARGDALARDLAAWGRAEGIRVRYTAAADVAAAARARPAVVLSTGTGALPALRTAGALPLSRLVDVAATTRDEPTGLGDAGGAAATTIALPVTVAAASIVWYDPAAFERAAITVPTTDGMLRSQSALIVGEDSGYPWCAGTAAGDATGRTLVDWLGEYVLRYGGLTQYDRWIRHEIPFNAPIVRRAAQKVYGLLLKPQQVDGGGPAIAATTPADAAAGLLKEDKASGECFLLHQDTADADGVPDVLAQRIAASGAGAVGAFPLPTPDGATPAVMGAAEYVSAFADDDATQRLVAYLTGTSFGVHGYRQGWPAEVSPHRSVGANRYSTALQRASATAIARARVFGTDAAAALPAGNIAGSELTKWAEQHKTIDAALKAVERAWPAG